MVGTFTGNDGNDINGCLQLQQVDFEGWGGGKNMRGGFKGRIRGAGWREMRVSCS